MHASPDSAQAPESSRKRPKPGERRLQILQAIASMLEEGQAEKVTTAALAARLGLSEAALYRHFASKAQMYEGLLDFIEQTIFGLINQIESRQTHAAVRGQEIVAMLLNFSEKNPGMTRVLIGDAIVNEDGRLQQRVNQILDRIEASLRQCARLSVAEQLGGAAVDAAPGAAAVATRSSMAVAFVQGRWLQFAKSGFKKRPTEGLDPITQVLFPG